MLKLLKCYFTMRKPPRLWYMYNIIYTYMGTYINMQTFSKNTPLMLSHTHRHFMIIKITIMCKTILFW